MKKGILIALAALGMTLFALGGCGDGATDTTFAQKKKPQTDSPAVPIVFVHGNNGSALQFQTQAQRFVSNAWPQDLLYAFEYNSGVPNPDISPLLDGFIDSVLVETGADQLYLLCHARGARVCVGYLNDPSLDGPDKVAKYVNVEGLSSAELPGGVPTIGIWGEWNTAGSGNFLDRNGDGTSSQIGPNPDDNYYFPEKAHIEVGTSAATFPLMYEFLAGSEPWTTKVVPEPPGQVTVGGRAVIFTANVNFPAGSSLEVYRVHAATGQRVSETPLYTAPLDATGNFGPIKVNGRKHYEFALTRPPDGSVNHFYFEPFIRDEHFLRLTTNVPGEGLEAFARSSPDTTNLLITRMKEYWGDQPESDSLTIDGLEILNPATSPRADVGPLELGETVAISVFDAGPVVGTTPQGFPIYGPPDGVTNVITPPFGQLFPFYALGAFSGVDVSTPTSPDASGTVAVTEVARGGGETILNVPNWPSDDDPITVQFRDDEPVAFPGKDEDDEDDDD